LDVVEKNNTEKGSNHSNNKLDIGGLWKSDHVQEVTFGKEVELEAPGGLLLHLLIVDLERLGSWVFIVLVVLELTLVVGVAEELDLFSIHILNIALRSLEFILIVSVWLLDTLNTHDAHKVI